MIRVGTAGWDYQDWNGVVYPRPRPRGFDPLAMLASLFDTIEINATFYRIPPPSSARSWVRRVGANPAFRFTVKLPGSFTHRHLAEGPRTATGRGAERREGGRGGRGPRSVPDDGPGGGTRYTVPSPGAFPASRSDPDTDERLFRAAIAPLQDANRLGAVLAQFPHSFHSRDETIAELAALLERFADLPMVAEFRHASWNAPAILDLLRRRGAGFCNIDQPMIGRTLAPTEYVTSAVAYVRLHGRNAAAWFAEEGGRNARYDYLYTREELSGWVLAVRRIAEEGADTYVIANNHFRGKAAVNALEIRAALEGGAVTVPEPLAAVYPELTPIAKGPRQKSLFAPGEDDGETEA